MIFLCNFSASNKTMTSLYSVANRIQQTFLVNFNNNNIRKNGHIWSFWVQFSAKLWNKWRKWRIQIQLQSSAIIVYIWLFGHVYLKCWSLWVWSVYICSSLPLGFVDIFKLNEMLNTYKRNVFYSCKMYSNKI